MEAKEQSSKSDKDVIKEYLEQGPHVYELYSVLIHSGSAFGGHYYAYVKSHIDGKWYNFNDAFVNEISEEELAKVYGGTPTSGYMLLYRKYGSFRGDDVENNGYKLREEDAP